MPGPPTPATRRNPGIDMPGSFDEATSFQSLCRAARRAARGKRQLLETARFLFRMEPEVLCLQQELRAGTYRPRPYRTFAVRDPKPRLISAAAFRDRVVHHALCEAVEPALERAAIAHSYACRPGKGLHAAIRTAQRFARRWEYVLKLDVQHFFETADHAVLKALLARRIPDARLLDLAALFVDAGAPGAQPGKGLPIGNLTSQHFANLYLAPLDQFVTRSLGLGGYVRYMDDVLVFAHERAGLWGARDAVCRMLRERLRLSLRDDATRVAPVTEGLPFLGLSIRPGSLRPSPRRVRAFRHGLRTIERQWREGALDEGARERRAAAIVGQTLHADALRMRRAFFERLARTGW